MLKVIFCRNTRDFDHSHVSFLYTVIRQLLSHTGQGDREADASKRWFIQCNSGRASNIGDITEKALEAGCAVSQYVNVSSGGDKI